jgi:uncharacterized protein YcfJ
MRKAMNKVSMIVAALMAAAISLPAAADDQYNDLAKVLSVTPQTERVNTPQQTCHTEYVRESYTQPSSPMGAIIGGIAGGLLGSQVGRGNGRIAGAAVGAGVGAVVGDRVGNNQSTGYADRPIERCTSVDHWQTVSRGYLVTYRYNGRDYTTVTDTPPGDTIHVNVAVTTGQAEQYEQQYDQRDAYYPPANQPVIIERSNYVYSPPVVGSVVISGSSGPGYRNGRGWDRGRGGRDSHYW